jgi:hypothetical protein
MESVALEKVAAISRVSPIPQKTRAGQFNLQCKMSPILRSRKFPMSFNLADKPLAERAALEDEKSRLFELWQNNLGKAKGEAARLFGERAKRKGKWAEWVRAELDAMSPPEYANMVRSEVNRLMAANK